MNCEECPKAEIEAELVAIKKENEKLRTVPMKYRRMRFNAELQARNDALESETAALKEKLEKAEAALKEARGKAFEEVRTFVCERYAAEVANRPDQNIYKSVLHGTWTQMQEWLTRALAEKEGAAFRPFHLSFTEIPNTETGERLTKPTTNALAERRGYESYFLEGRARSRNRR